MRKSKSLNIRSASSGTAFQPPMNFYQNAVRRLSAGDPMLSASFGKEGRVRTLMSGSATGLGTLPFGGDPLAHAKQFLSQPNINQALGLKNVSLADGRTDKFDFGTVKLSRVEMQQVIRIGDTDVPVRGGYVHVSMDNTGKVVNVTNTVKFGRRPAALPTKMLSGDQAIEICKTKLGVGTASGTSRLVLSEHEGKFGFVHEVKLTSSEPRHAMFYLVLAKTGEIVYEQSIIRTSVTSPAQAALSRIPVKCFLAIPDPKKTIPSQVVDHFIESLPDPKVLKDHRFIMLVQEGGKWVEVKANKDGDFKFDSEKESSKFSAVVTYVALRAQYEFLESLGMKKQDRPIKVFIDDPSVSDNAYFDPEAYEIHMGVGSGGSWGLTKHISFDLGVEWHENGHHVVYLQTPGQDLPGDEGAGMHESTGDVLGQLCMQYLWGALYGKQLGKELTLAAIQADPRIIGFFAMPPNGIRKQRNKKTTKNKTGEPHDDGEISGAAHADLLQTVIETAVGESKTIVDGVTAFAKLYLGALALVPAHTVRFSDMLVAMKSADTTLFNGKYQAAIVKAHAGHGITETSSGSAASGQTDITIDIDEDAGDALVSKKKPGGSKGRKSRSKRRKA